MKDTVLVVDDEAGVRSSLAGILGDEGYAVETVDSGEAALRRLLDVRLVLGGARKKKDADWLLGRWDAKSASQFALQFRKLDEEWFTVGEWKSCLADERTNRALVDPGLGGQRRVWCGESLQRRQHDSGQGAARDCGGERLHQTGALLAHQPLRRRACNWVRRPGSTS